MSDLAIEVRNLSKTYRIYGNPWHRLMEVAPWWPDKMHREEFLEINPADAAALGVYLHGTAGECVRDELGDTGMIASDLLPMLPRAIKDLRSPV